jgi:NDP-sugar pyrophosphorylase family protein
MAILRNEDRWDVSNVLYEKGRVLAYDKHAPTSEMRWIDYGLGGLTVDALSAADGRESDLAHVYQRLAALDRLCGYEATERFYEIGTPSGLEETDAFLRELADAG